MLVEALGSPSNVTRTWSLQRQAPTSAPPTKVIVRTVGLCVRPNEKWTPVVPSPLQPTRRGEIELTVPTEPPCTVGQLKALLMTRLNISPRKGLSLTWWGAVLEPDERTLQELHVQERRVVQDTAPGQKVEKKAPVLELTLRELSQKELESLKELSVVRVRASEGQCVVLEDVGPNTQVKACKETIVKGKLFGPLIDPKAPPPMELFYSPCFNSDSVFGNAMGDEKTLGEYGVMNNDLLFLKLPPPEKEEGGGKDKKGGGKKKK